LNNVLWAIDEAKLQVERIIFGQMPAGGTRFGAINVTCFKNALESSHADEFIAKCQRSIFDQRLWTHRVENRKRIKGEVLPRAIEDVDFKDVQLSRFRAILSPYSPDNFNGIFELQMVFFDGFGSGNTLSFPRAILQNYVFAPGLSSGGKTHPWAS
jgi:hypothetical protein